MTKTFFPSRAAARNANIGTPRDAGKDAPDGQRWFVEVVEQATEVAPAVAEVAESPVKESALGHPMPANSVRFDSLPMNARFTTPDLKGVYVKVSETRGQAEAVNGTLSQLFEGDEYVMVRPVWTHERNQNGDPIADNPKMAAIYAQMDYYGMTKERDGRSRNQREGRYAFRSGRPGGLSIYGKPLRYKQGDPRRKTARNRHVREGAKV